jgi:hypothetical protein
MAKVKNNSLFAALQGTIGEDLVFKQYADKVVVSKYPDMSKVKPSERQLEQRKKMAEAIVYAKSVMRNPALNAAYEKDLKPGESVYKKAVRDFLKKREEN